MLHSTRKGHSLPARSLLIFAVTFGLAFLLSAAPPVWWQQRGVFVPSSSADDYAVVNQGQLKHLATAAYDEFNAQLPGGAGSTLEGLIRSWYQTDAGGNFLLNAQGQRRPLVTAQTDDFSAVNLGQLKAVAKPFYDRLFSAGYPVGYPWAGQAPDDYALANLGQIKHLFSFNAQLYVGGPTGGTGTNPGGTTGTGPGGTGGSGSTTGGGTSGGGAPGPGPGAGGAAGLLEDPSPSPPALSRRRVRVARAGRGAASAGGGPHECLQRAALLPAGRRGGGAAGPGDAAYLAA